MTEGKVIARAGNFDDMPIYALADGTRGKLYQGNVAPDPSQVNFWIDDGVGLTLKVWTGSAWEAVAEGEGGGGGDAEYLHEQGAASATWTVNHNLGKYPAVTVMDSSGKKVEGRVVFNSSNQLTLYFSAPFSGTASCN
jgi:hypothetical protein